MRTITVEMSSSGMANLRKELATIEKNLKSKSTIFVNRLASIGIRTAYQSSGRYAGQITFEKRVGANGSNKASVIMFGVGQEITNVWMVKNGETHDETINTLLMAEFGSGARTENKFSTQVAVGQRGSLNKYGHAFDEGGWSWEDESGWHHSYGETPSHPMYNAYKEMVAQIQNVASGVFNSNA